MPQRHSRRWVLFEDIITENGYKIIFEDIKTKDNTLPNIFSRSSILQEWSEEQSPIGGECFNFAIDNKLKNFLPNTYKFKPRDHIVLDDIQECILDNFFVPI